MINSVLGDKEVYDEGIILAAVRIQAFFRGTAARIKVTTMIEEMFETGELSVGSDEDTDLT